MGIRKNQSALTADEKARFVNEELCTGCQECISNCVYKEPKFVDEFNEGLGKRKPVYIPFPQATPQVVLDAPASAIAGLRAAGAAQYAGQGASLGHTFEQLAAIRDAIPKALRRRAAVCVDTCHLFAAGYDLTTDEGYAATFDALDRTIGLGLVKAFHLNDSKKPLGCRVDRHEHIGEGEMGLAPFRFLVNDPRFADHPAFLETELRFKENLQVLRSLRR